MSTNINTDSDSTDSEKETRRDFLVLTTVAMATVGAGLAAWPFIDSMNPAADVIAGSSTELDLAPIKPGQMVTVVWRGKPVFVGHRTADQIAHAKADDAVDMIDPEPNSARVQRDEWLIAIGVCTHLGCIPLGQNVAEPKGDFGGWFCQCHGSHYDTSGRIRKGPAPRNLDIPPYGFISETRIRIG